MASRTSGPNRFAYARCLAMPKICYQPKKFSRDTLAIIELSEKICVE